MNIAARMGIAAILISSAGLYAVSSGDAGETAAAEAEIRPDGAAMTRPEIVPPPLDMYGNEVTSAIAKYKMDPSGVMYEVHSPATEVPRLGIPRS